MRNRNIIVPHLSWPLRFTLGGLRLVEQDSLDDIAHCVEAILRTPVGSRAELPDFGFTDPTFEEGDIDIVELVRAIEEWEPRVHVLVNEEPDRFDEMIRRVQVEVRGREING